MFYRNVRKIESDHLVTSKLLTTEPQNRWGWKGPLEEQAHIQLQPPKLSCPGPCPRSFWSSLGNLCQGLVTLPARLKYRGSLLCPSLCPLPLVHHRIEAGPVLFAPAFQVFTSMNKNLPWSSPGWSFPFLPVPPSPLGLFIRFSPVAPSLSWTVEPRTAYSTPDMALPVLSRGEGSFPSTCWQHSS